MCCPSNEPSRDNQPTCPPPSLTVLDPHGFPLKCSPRSRTCPQERMICVDVGLAYVCCEQVQQEVLTHNSVAFSKRRRAPQSKGEKGKRRTSVGPEQFLDCPLNSIGLLNGDGSRMQCNSKTKCSGRNTFCHGDLKRSICCERYEFATSVLDSVEGTATSNVESPNKSQDAVNQVQMVETKSAIVKESIETPTRMGSASARTSRNEVVDIPSPATRNSVMTHDVLHSKSDSTATVQVDSISSTSTAPFENTSPETSATTARTNSSVPARLVQLRQQRVEFSTTFPSQLLSRQDKRSMAQQFLLHQIRNGWPYDERFYRKDLDAFSPEQRRDMARMQFSDG
ncbi:hypothetical protein GCK32_000138 [Trichostrongylus colubriformis]|uniref:Uncharacterized protein n=1 Tax=Trichostrongylus colubriformis TaxID=6319 RepID=A0AAN8FSM6_TRICO